MNAATGNASQTARQRARAELTREIKEAARRQLAEAGAQQLSLRAVARELGLVSSALYRYFPSRDDLLTALIIDAYDSLGECAEAAAASAAGGARSGWRAVCHAVRSWAVAHPHEYALIYGSPVPGYRAPQDTVTHAVRVPVVIGALVRGSWAAQAADGTAPDGAAGPAMAVADIPEVLAAQAATVAEAIAPGVPEPVIVRVLIAWTQLFGMISFELFGQFVGSADPADELFAYAVEQMAAYIPLAD